MARDLPLSLDPLTLPPPPVGTDQAADWAARHWGLRGAEVRRLSGEKDANFLLDLPDGTRRLLKIGHERESRDLLDMQAGLMAHLRRVPDGPVVPEVLPAVGGRPFVEVEAGGASCPARLLTWIGGRPLHEHPSDPGLRRKLGALAGRLMAAGAGFDHPAADHRLAWDVAQAGAMRDLARTVTPDPLRPALRALFSTLDDPATTAMLADLPRQVIHNDLNPHNVIVDEWGGGFAVIDFGDSVRTFRIAELAVALAYALDDQADWDAAAADVLSAAFDRVWPTDAEIAALALLVETRLALSVIIPHWRAARYPGDAAYILRNTPRAAAALAALEGGARRRLERLILEIVR